MEAHGPAPDDRTYNAAITVCSSACRWQEAMRLLDTMPVRPTAFSYNLTIKACSEAGKPELASSLLVRMRKAGVPPDTVSCATVITAWAREGEPDKALECLEEMRRRGPSPDLVCYNAAISALEKSERGAAARQLLQEMDARRVRPNDVSYSATISACAKAHMCEEALELLREMRRVGLSPGTYAYSSAITACERVRDTDRALALLEEMRTAGVSPDAHCFNSAISACAKASQHAAALGVLSQMQSRGVSPTVVSYNAAISSCGAAQWEVSLQLLEEMRQRGIEPNSRSYAAVITSCGKAQQCERALRLLAEMEAAGVAPCIISHNTAISACEKSGEWEKAMQLLQKMEQTKELEPTVVSYNATMAACEKALQWAKALELLPRLKGRGLSPDLITYTTLISACAKVGEHEAALRLLRQMDTEDGIRPHVPCYTSAIASCEKVQKPEVALSLLQEAEALQQPLDASLFAATMRVLVAAGQIAAGFELLARVHANADVMATGTFVVHWTLLSACSTAGDAAGAARVQGFMDYYKLESLQAVAHAVVHGTDVRFEDGAEGTPPWLREELRSLWRRVHAQTEYEPCFEAIPHAARERFEHNWAISSLQHHAEKKALAELLRQGSDVLTVRVNLKMCADCHAFFKGAAKLVRRRITVHELDTRGSRAHTFDEGGRCSCAGRARDGGAPQPVPEDRCVEIDSSEVSEDGGSGAAASSNRLPKRPREDYEIDEGGHGKHVAKGGTQAELASCAAPIASTALKASGDQSQLPPLRERVRHEIDRFAVEEGELAAIMRANGLVTDPVTSARMIDAAVLQIARSLEARGVRSYKLSRGDSETEVRRIQSVRRYFEKLVRNERDKLVEEQTEAAGVG